METKPNGPEHGSPEPPPRSTGTLVGLILWRGGVYFTSGYLAYVGSRWILTLLLEVGIPAQVLMSAALIAGGVLLILISVVVERVVDARAEASLRNLY